MINLYIKVKLYFGNKNLYYFLNRNSIFKLLNQLYKRRIIRFSGSNILLNYVNIIKIVKIYR